MSQENVEFLREAYATWNRQNHGWLSERIAEDFELLPAGEFPGLDTAYRGQGGWETFLDHWGQAWDSHCFTIKRIEDLGDQVLVLVISEGRGKGSGVTVEMETAHLWTVRGELFVRGVMYASWQRALEAVGLPE